MCPYLHNFSILIDVTLGLLTSGDAIFSSFKQTMAVLSVIIRYLFNKDVLCSRGEALEGSDSEEEDDVGEFPGRREVIAFLNWLTFCDKVRGARCKANVFRYLYIIYRKICKLLLLYINIFFYSLWVHVMAL